jgi:citrate lyase subunit beta-like protein
VPGNDQRKIQKSVGLDVDAVVLDCEDGVAMNRKEEARLSIVRALSAQDFGNSECIIRINSYCSGLATDDLQAILTGPVYPDAIILPKAASAEQVYNVCDAIAIIS